MTGPIQPKYGRKEPLAKFGFGEPPKWLRCPFGFPVNQPQKGYPPKTKETDPIELHKLPSSVSSFSTPCSKPSFTFNTAGMLQPWCFRPLSWGSSRREGDHEALSSASHGTHKRPDPQRSSDPLALRSDPPTDGPLQMGVAQN